MKIRILGCGTSSGVPRIGNDWGVCDPAEPRNRRSRASILVENGSTRLLVDTGPDMREQLLEAEVSRVDAVIWTHDHADHCHGIDDLRQLFHAMRAPVRGLARAGTMRTLETRFAYAFQGRPGYPPTITAEGLPDRLSIGDIDLAVTDQPHGNISSAGLKFTANGKAVGYATDFHTMTPAMRDLYRGLDLWVVDALRYAPHPAHPTVTAVLNWVEELQPRRTVFVHMDQSMDYATLCRSLPPGVEPGFDGMVINL